MKRKDLMTIGLVAVVAGLLSLTLSSTLVGSSGDNKDTAPVVEKIDPAFPDITNDPAYNSFLNSKALDPTQPVQIGDNQNSKPFNQ